MGDLPQVDEGKQKRGEKTVLFLLTAAFECAPSSARAKSLVPCPLAWVFAQVLNRGSRAGLRDNYLKAPSVIEGERSP